MKDVFYHGLKLCVNSAGRLSIKNPMLDFVQAVKDGDFDEFTDEEYEAKLGLIERISYCVFHDHATVSPVAMFDYFLKEKLIEKSDQDCFDEIFDEEWNLLITSLKQAVKMLYGDKGVVMACQQQNLDDLIYSRYMLTKEEKEALTGVSSEEDEYKIDWDDIRFEGEQ